MTKERNVRRNAQANSALNSAELRDRDQLGDSTRAPTLAKIAYVISKSFDFIEIKMISSDFNIDFRFQKSIKCVGDLTRDILLGAY